MSVVRNQPQGIARLNRASRMFAGALSVIGAPQAGNLVSGIALKHTMTSAAARKAGVPRGMALPFRKNWYIETETLPAIGTADYTEFWVGYPNLTFGQGGTSGGTYEPAYLTGSALNRIGITGTLGTRSNTNGQGGQSASQSWGAVYGWNSGNASLPMQAGANDMLVDGQFAVLVVVRKQTGMEFWRDGVLVNFVAGSPVSIPAQSMFLGSLLANANWYSASDTMLAGRILGAWNGEEISRFAADPFGTTFLASTDDGDEDVAAQVVPLAPVGAPSTQGGTSPGAALTQTHKLVGATSSQANTSGTAGIGESHITLGAPSFQPNTSPGGAITQGHALVGAASTQANTSAGGSLAQALAPTGAASSQPNISSAGAITQTHNLVGAPSSQANTSGTGVIGEQHIALGAPSFQPNTSTSGAITQSHALAGAPSTQASTSPGGAVAQAQAGQLVGAASMQVSTSSTGALTQSHVLAGAASSQASTSPGAALVQTHALVGRASAQASTSTAAALGQTHALVGAPSSQVSTSGVGVIGEQHVAIGAPSFQPNASPGGAILQFHRPQGAGSTQNNTSPGGAALQTVAGVERDVLDISVSPQSLDLAGDESVQLRISVTTVGGASQEVSYQTKLGRVSPEGIYTSPRATGSDMIDTIVITPIAKKTLSVTVQVRVRAGLFDSWGIPIPDQKDLTPLIWPELDEPTEQQAESGRYRKDRMKLYGLRIVIENPRGSIRRWKAADGTRGSTQMHFAYGYIAGTLGNDGDELDCTIGPSPLNAEAAYVVNQFIDGQFDEHKIMLGFSSQSEAEAAYLGNYSHGWNGLESCIACSIDELNRWISDGDKSRPLTEEQISNEGMTMEKVLWDSANLPRHMNLEQVLYSLRRHDAADGLLYDAVSVADILAGSDGVLTFDALVIPFARIQQRMGIMQKVLDRAGKDIKVAAMQVSDPFMQRGSANVAVVFELTDGQTVSVFFHNPDVTPKKLMAADELVSWKWMLNKKDITVAVAPEKGRDLVPRMVAARIMALAEKNSDRFVKANGKRAERLQTISSLQTELDTKKATLADLEQQVVAAEAAADAAGHVDPAPVVPDPQPEPETAPARALDVDSLKGVLAESDPMATVPHGANWVIMNAPRPLMGTETMSNGEFLTGRFYAAIDPADDMASAYIAENVKLDARVVFVADAATQQSMALNTINPTYLPAYMGMDDDERGPALRGFIDKLNNRTISELKELAAKGVPVLPQPDPDPEPTPDPQPTPDPDAEARAQEEAAKAAADAAAQAEAEAEAQAARDAQAAREAEEAAAAEAAAKQAQEAEESADTAFLALAAEGTVDFYDKAVTDRLAALATKYADTDGPNLDLIMRAKTAAKNFFIAEFKKKVG